MRKDAEHFLLDDKYAAYDQAAKRILAQKAILAIILKRVVIEFADVPTEEIAAYCIEGEPEVGRIAVGRDRTNATRQAIEIKGNRNEDSSPTEGWVTFDVLFRAIVPSSKERITLLVNLEAQRTQNRSILGYTILHRALYYVSRLISSQKETEFHGSDYDGAKKVYSIWLCFDAPEGEDAINSYHMQEDQLLGDYKADKSDYDLVNVVTVYLGQRETQDKLLRLLRLLFRSKLSAQEKKRRLKEEYNLDILQDFEKEVDEMCNLSEGIFEQGIEQGLAQGMERGIMQGAERTAVGLLRENMPMDLIVRVTSLSLERLMELKEDIAHSV